MRQKHRKILLLMGDIFFLSLSLYLTLEVRYLGRIDLETWYRHLSAFSAVFFIWLFIFYISNLYNLHIVAQKNQFYKTTLNSVLLSGLLSALYFYLNPKIGIAPKTNLIIFIIIFSLIFIFWRKAFNTILKSYIPKNNLAFIGYNNEIKELILTLKHSPQLGFNPILVFSENSNFHDPNIFREDFIHLKEKLAKYKITTLVLSDLQNLNDIVKNELFKTLPLKINYLKLSKFYEMLIGKIPLESINQLWFLENLSEGNKKIFDFSKRIYDIIFSLLIFLTTVIFWPLIGLVIRIESKGPVYFMQKRVGKSGRIFTIYKFRTMTVSDNHFQPTEKKDKRVTRFGSFLRKTRIDEIPQILNVIVGDMSFVGPRPERPEIVETLEKQIPFYSERLLVKPGLTGSDQISGEYHSPSVEDTIKKLQYDLFYIKNRSIYLDISIILKTIATVLSKKGM